MGIENLVNQRNALMNEAQSLINEGKIEEANAKMTEVETLDKQIEEAVKAKKNFEVLNNAAPMLDIAKAGVDKAKAEKFSNGGTLELEDSAEDDGKAEAKEKAYEKAWAKVVMGCGSASDRETVRVYNDAFTHTTENTGIVIPETVARGILDDVVEMHPFWADVAKTYVKGKFKLIKSDSSSDAKWYDEPTPIEDGKETFGEYTLDGCELARSITVSWKLKEMAVSDFIPFIRKKLADKMGAALGYGVVNGKGKPGLSDDFKAEPLGVITAINAEDDTPQVMALTKPTDGQIVEALIKVNGLIGSKYANGTAIYVNNSTLWNRIAPITDTTGRPVFMADANTTGGVGRVFGKTVKIDQNIPDNEILLGNASAGYQANINRQVSLDMEDHKKARETDYIAYAIVDGAPITTKAFALITITD